PEFPLLTLDGEEGLFDPLFFEEALEEARASGFWFKVGLPSAGEMGEGVVDCGFFMASVLKRWMTSLFAFSNTVRFLNVKVPKSSPPFGSLRRLPRPSRTCGGIERGTKPRLEEFSFRTLEIAS